MHALVHYDDKQIALASAVGAGLVVPKPFGQDIFLTEFKVVGNTFGMMVDPLTVREGTKLKLVRDTRNKFDKNSIVIKDKADNRIGFVPMAKNEIMARLLEAGKELYAVVSREVASGSECLELDVKVYMGA